MAKRAAAKAAAKPPEPIGDMDGVMGLDLARAPLSAAMQAYFDKCREKIGFVPNVLAAYAHDMAKL